MPTPEAEQAILDWLTKSLPGGRWIAPHWKDGPWYLVPVLAAEDVNWQIRLILDAFPPLLENLPIDNGWSLERPPIHAVPEFIHDTLNWHEDPETGLSLFAESIIGPLDHEPTLADVLANLTAIMTMSRDDPGDIAELVAKLPTDDPATTLAALCSLDPSVADEDDREALVVLLECAVAITA